MVEPKMNSLENRSGLWARRGSNASPSAYRAGSRREPSLREAPYVVCDGRTYTIQVHGRRRRSTVFAHNWRTGAPRRVPSSDNAAEDHVPVGPKARARRSEPSPSDRTGLTD